MSIQQFLFSQALEIERKCDFAPPLSRADIESTVSELSKSFGERFGSSLKPMYGAQGSELFAVGTVMAGISEALFSALNQTVRNGAGSEGVPQEVAHHLVDLWGRREAAIALLRGLSGEIDGIGECSQGGATRSRAALSAVLFSLGEVVFLLVREYGARWGFAPLAPLVEWSEKQKNLLAGAVSEQIDHIAV